jgi:hypothetical protein
MDLGITVWVCAPLRPRPLAALGLEAPSARKLIILQYKLKYFVVFSFFINAFMAFIRLSVEGEGFF